jgi:hypothetical protein
MELPITEKELKYIMEEVKYKNKPLYNKLWSYKFALKYKKDNE